VPGDPALGFESEAMERAAETWSGRWWVAGGGGTVWDAIVFDPALDLVYVGTGNGSPWPRDLRSPGGGDNLYLSSILALRAGDGSLVWHYQTTPGDHWDYTATQPLMLAELEIDGQARSVIMQAPKNGFFYVLDRETGELISAEAYAKISWATGVDPATGRPIESPTAYRGTEPVVVAPGPQGAHNWHPMAYSPLTGLVYLPIREDNYTLHPTDVDWTFEPRWWNTGRDPLYEGPMRARLAELNQPVGRLLAWDPVEQREAWGVRLPVVQGGGVLATAGNLVFAGSGSGALVAYRANDGSPLWEFDAATGIIAPPVTYLVDGVQHVTLMVGWGGAAGLSGGTILGPVVPGYGRVLTFALDGNAAFSPPPFGSPAQAVPSVTVAASADMLRLGERLYNGYCSVCHGVPAVRGPLPDLAYSTAHEQIEAIVLGGQREYLGMPSFDGLITYEQLRAIQAYVLSQAAAATPR
jgi:quinohemoprotein ethanol dehydrogenase